MPQSTQSHQMPIFDGHNDTLLRLCLPERGKERSFFTRSDFGHIDFPRIREAGFSGGMFAIFIPSPTADYSGLPVSDRLTITANGYEMHLEEPIDDLEYAYRVANDMIAHLIQLEESADGGVKIVKNVQELTECLAHDVLAVVLHFEGAEAIDPQLRNLDAFYQHGLRSLGIVWSRPNAFGCGVPFKFPTSPDIGPGLTDAGKQLVHACNTLGVMLDLSHLNEKGVWDVAKLSKKPLVATHSAAHALVPKSRNLTDDQLKAIRDSNGVVGVTFAIYDLCADGRLEGDAPLSVLIDHIRYIAERIGIDHVAFGSDFDGATISQEIKDVTGLPKVIDALRQCGFDEAALRKVTHENWLRVLRDTWKD